MYFEEWMHAQHLESAIHIHQILLQTILLVKEEPVGGKS